MDVVGSVVAEENTAAVRRIHELWDEYPNLLAVRNSVQIQEVGELATHEIDELTSSTVYDLIEAHIKNTDLHDLWLEMTKEMQNAD